MVDVNVFTCLVTAPNRSAGGEEDEGDEGEEEPEVELDQNASSMVGDSDVDAASARMFVCGCFECWYAWNSE